MLIFPCTAFSAGNLVPQDSTKTIGTVNKTWGTSYVRKYVNADKTTVTINSGTIAVTRSFHLVDTESSAASDDLTTVTGMVDGQVLILGAANAARTVIIKNGTGNIVTFDGSDITLDNLYKGVYGVYDGTINKLKILGGSATGGVLTDSVSTTSSVIGASATAVKTAYDLANGKQAADVDLNSLASGMTGLVKGLGNGSGYTPASAGTDYQAPLTNPVTGPASPTAGLLAKWGPTGDALVDGLKYGTMTDTKYCTYSTVDGLICTSVGGVPYTTGTASALPGSCTAPALYYATDTYSIYICENNTFSLLHSLGSDGAYKAVFPNNSSIAPTGSEDALYFEANLFKMNENGTERLVASAAAREVDGHASGALSAEQVSGTVVYNTGMGTADVALTLPTAAAGYNALFTVATAQTYKWGVRAEATDKIYLIASDGTISAGSDNGYARMTNAQAGQQFACWTFKTDAYDWACKAIAVGTSSFAAN